MYYKSFLEISQSLFIWKSSISLKVTKTLLICYNSPEEPPNRGPLFILAFLFDVFFFFLLSDFLFFLLLPFLLSLKNKITISTISVIILNKKYSGRNEMSLHKWYWLNIFVQRQIIPSYQQQHPNEQPKHFAVSN